MAVISPNFLLTSRAFPYSLLDFILRIGYALTPWKTFWFGEFSSTGLYYGSPVFVPFMMVFLVPFLYASIFCIPIFYRKNKKIMYVYYLLIGLMLFGLVQPVFNITNPYFGFEPSEGIFALPFYSMLTAFSFYLFLDYCFKVFNRSKNIPVTSSSRNFAPVGKSPNRRAIVAVLIAILVLFAGINMVNFTDDLFFSSNASYQDNTNSVNYMFYGWNHVTNYLIKNHLNNETIYYTPGKEGSYNLTNNCNLNYWYYHQNFPLYWIYAFSDGKIKKIDLLYSGALPPVPKNSSIILSQNASYPRFLSSNGIDNTILYTVYRENGKPAIEVIKVKNEITTSERNNLSGYNLFYKNNISKFEEFNLTSLTNLNSQITVSIKFSLIYGSLKFGKGYNPVNSTTPTFSLGIWPQNIFIHGADNKSFVLIGAIYSNFGNYSAPNTWQRLYDYTPLNYNTIACPNFHNLFDNCHIY